MRTSLGFAAAALGAGSALAAPPRLESRAASAVNQTTCGGKTYSYNEMAGYGFIPGNSTDKYGDTIGGIGSSIAFNRTSWTKNADGSYSGELFALPDRGWNTQGTLNFQGRVHKFGVTLTPRPNATVSSPSGPNVAFTYKDTILFYDPTGTPTTGLDADPTGGKKVAGFPDLPAANYTGDGFGGSGPGGYRVTVDDEGLVLASDGGFWISDEYGPYIYKYGPTGVMTTAIRPPEAIVPYRNNTESFSADSPTEYSGQTDDVNPPNPVTGRVNNHGFEGLTASPDGCQLYSLLQGAAIQEGGAASKTERYVRLVQYDVCSSATPTYKAEYVVPLPTYVRASTGKTRVADQSEIHYISSTQFLVLARDSGAGRAAATTQSVYRHADVFDITNATNILGNTYDGQNSSIASSDGVLKSGITAATYCSWLDYNVNSQLNRFGVHNGGTDNSTLLNEKWESLALVPVDGANGSDGNWFLFSLSDDDFITQSGALNNGSFTYSDNSGYNLDNQALVFQVSLPGGSKPA